MAGIESGDRKEMYRIFYRSFTAIYRNFTAIFLGLGGRNPAPPPPSLLVAAPSFNRATGNRFLLTTVETSLEPLGQALALGDPSPLR